MKRNVLAAVLLLLLIVVSAAMSTESRHVELSMSLYRCVRKCKVNFAKCIKRCQSRGRTLPNSEEELLSVHDDNDDEDDNDDDEDDGESTPTPSKPIDPKMIWQNYRDELFRFLKRGGDVTGMQLMRNPIIADWDQDASKLNAFANRISAWGVEYSPRKGISVPSQYGLFLDSIDIDTSSTGGSEGSNPAIAGAQAAYDSAMDRLTQFRDRCKKLYERYPGTKPEYPDFEAQRCTMVGSAEYNVMIKKFELDQVKRASAGPNADLADARAEFIENDGSFSWTESVLSTLARFKQRVARGSTSSFSISVTKTSNSNTVQKEWTQLDTMSDFVTVEDKGSEEKEKKKKKKKNTKFTFSTSAENFKMDIRSVGYTNIQINPDNWFSHSMLDKYKTGPFTGKVNFFGKKGNFNQMTKSLYVLYKPSISLYVEKNDALSFKTLSDEATVKLGPFPADDIDVSDKPVTIKGNKKIYKVDFSVSTEEPIVIAVDNHIF